MHRTTKIPKTRAILRKKNKAGGITLPECQTILKTILIKTGGIGIKTYTEINGLEQNPDINPHRYGQLIYNKAAKKYTAEKGQSLQ